MEEKDRIASNEETAGKALAAFVAGVVVTSILYMFYQMVGVDTDGRDFYWNWVFKVEGWTAAIWAVLCLMYLWLDWISPFKAPRFSYRVSFNEKDKHTVILLADGKPVSAEKWKQLVQDANQEFSFNVTKHIIAKGFESSLEAINKGQSLVDAAVARFGSTKTTVLIKDSGKVQK